MVHWKILPYILYIFGILAMATRTQFQSESSPLIELFENDD